MGRLGAILAPNWRDTDPSVTPPRIYLTGHVTLEHGERLITEDAFPGRQGRLAFVYLIVNRHRSVTRADLSEVLWTGEAPPESDAAISALLSKIRATLKAADVLPAIEGRSVAIGVKLPPGTWVDTEAAGNALDEGEGALREGDARKAWGCANVAVSIARRPFLPDQEGAWVQARRTWQHAVLMRGLECLARASEAAGQMALAIEHVTQVIELEPFRESAYRDLMRLHQVTGNGGEAIRVYERCRRVLREELGASPSPQTEAAFLGILREGR